MQKSKPRTPVMHHFVDEAGDLSLFNKRQQVVLGTEGVSNHFMVGVAYVPDPQAIESRLSSLRAALLGDPLLNTAPSMDPARKKTALYFHAKDDLPEVRYAVFRALTSFDIKIFVAIRNKHVLAEQARVSLRYGSRISENDIYHDLISRLLKNRLHLADENQIVVARRGTKERKSALTMALEKAQGSFQARWGKRQYGPSEITTAHPSEYAGLQVVDYFLWALQRLYERGEERFFSALSQHYRLVMDLDDTRRRPYGEWYTNSNRLTLKKLKLVTG
jgi:hypothetical protein